MSLVIDDDGICRIPVDQDYVIDPPILGTGRRARNWLAVLEPDPQRPGGVNRVWCERGKGPFAYSIRTLLSGDLIEFGADWLSASSDYRHRERWYAHVLRVETFALVVRHFSTLKELLRDAYDRKVQPVPLQAPPIPLASPETSS
jgi:hypothetical protein